MLARRAASAVPSPAVSIVPAVPGGSRRRGLMLTTIAMVAVVLLWVFTQTSIGGQQAASGSTRALDGRQSATWAQFEASWTYHPDDGLDVLVRQL